MRNLSRRRFVVATGAIAVGTTGTIYTLSDSTDAISVSMGTLEIPDKEHAGEITEIIAAIDLEIEYEADSPPDQIEIQLNAGDTYSRPTEVRTKTMDSLSSTTDVVETAISGDILHSSSLSVSSWDFMVGQETTVQDVEIEVIVSLIQDGEIATDSVTTISEVRRHKQTGTIEVAGSGELSIN